MTEFILTMLLVSLVLFFAERPLRPKHGNRRSCIPGGQLYGGLARPALPGRGPADAERKGWAHDLPRRLLHRGGTALDVHGLVHLSLPLCSVQFSSRVKRI
jgi:hypothetical protein